MGVIYAGVFLEQSSEAKLRHWWESTQGPLHPKVYCHHMTVAFKPDQALLDAFPLRVNCALKVVGWMSNEFCQVVKVKPSCALSFPVANAHPHVTVATNGKPPSYSNELLEAMGTVGVLNGPTLSAWTGLWDGELGHAVFAPVPDGPTLDELSGSLKT